MKLSDHTLKVLKNFSTINPSILIRAGSMLSTQAIAGNIVAEAQIEEEFPIKFALYDLVEFLNTLKLFNSPVIDFRNGEDNFIYICEEDNLDFKVRYTFAKEEHLVYPERKPVMGDINVTFKLDTVTLDSITKASNVMQLPFMTILPDSKKDSIVIEVTDIKNSSSNKFSISIDGTSPQDKEFKLIFKMDTFKMLPNDYMVNISGKYVASFESNTIDYYIGLDVNSKF